MERQKEEKKSLNGFSVCFNNKNKKEKLDNLLFYCSKVDLFIN